MRPEDTHSLLRTGSAKRMGPIRGAERARMELDGQAAVTFSAWKPFGPCLTSNSTVWPSVRDLYPSI